MLTSQCSKLSRVAMTLVTVLVAIPLMLMSCTEKTVFILEEETTLTEEPIQPDFGAAELDTFPEPPVAPPTPPPAPPAPDASNLVPPPPPPPPQIKKPTSEQLDQWISDARTYGLWLDGKRIVNSELRKIIDDEVIYYYSIKEISPRAQKVANSMKLVRLYSEKNHYENLEDYRKFRAEYDEKYISWVNESGCTVVKKREAKREKEKY